MSNYAGLDDGVDANPEPKPLRGAGPRLLLERGHPKELAPDGTIIDGSPSKLQEMMKNAARKYCADAYNSDEAKLRVYDTWLKGEYRAPYQPFTPRPGKEADFG